LLNYLVDPINQSEQNNKRFQIDCTYSKFSVMVKFERLKVACKTIGWVDLPVRFLRFFSKSKKNMTFTFFLSCSHTFSRTLLKS